MARIAVLDRNEAAAAELAALIEGLGHRTKVFVDEEAALVALAGNRPGEEPFAAAVLGLRLRRLPGLVVAREIASARPSLPLVVATDYPSLDTVLEARRLRLADYLVKPVLAGDLRQALARAGLDPLSGVGA